MWFVMFFSGLALILVHAVWFSGRIAGALGVLAPGRERWLRWGRRGYLAVAMSLPLFTLLGAVFGGTRHLPEGALTDYLIVFPFWLVTIHALQTTLLILPIELAHFGLRKLGAIDGARWYRRKSALVLAVAAVLAVYVPIRVATDGRQLDVRTHVYASPEVPAALDGFRIALIGDLQADRHTGPEELGAFVEAVEREEPDLILSAGDTIGRGPEHIDLAAEHAGGLAAPHGVLSAIGDHDNFAYHDHARSVREVTAALSRHGVEMLDDQVRVLEVGGARLAVIVATNNYIQEIDEATARRLLDEAAGADVTALVTHQTTPALVDAAREAGVELLLTGHTHGGQIRFWLPFMDLSSPRIETPYVAGAYELGEMLLVTTNGLGTSVAPFRYRAPPTIDVIRLERAVR